MKQGPQFFCTKRLLHMSASAPKMPQLIRRDLFISVHPNAICCLYLISVWLVRFLARLVRNHAKGNARLHVPTKIICLKIVTIFLQLWILHRRAKTLLDKSFPIEEVAKTFCKKQYITLGLASRKYLRSGWFDV